MIDHRPTPATTSPAQASELRIATFRLARRMRTQRAVDSMSDGQFAVLAGLFIHGSHTLGELADRERVSAPVDEPHSQLPAGVGLRHPIADESDGRKVVISLTDEGRAVVDETARRRDAWVEEALAALDARGAPNRLGCRQDHAADGRPMSAMFRSFSVFNYRVWFIGALVSNIGAWMQATAPAGSSSPSSPTTTPPRWA